MGDRDGRVKEKGGKEGGKERGDEEEGWMDRGRGDRVWNG